MTLPRLPLPPRLPSVTRLEMLMPGRTLSLVPSLLVLLVMPEPNREKPQRRGRI